VHLAFGSRGAECAASLRQQTHGNNTLSSQHARRRRSTPAAGASRQSHPPRRVGAVCRPPTMCSTLSAARSQLAWPCAALLPPCCHLPPSPAP
jgi:hypothetical protein